MRKITAFIVNKRNVIVVIFIILSIICAILSNKVKTNDDMTKYLPSTSETRKGLDIMEDEFSDTEDSSSFNLMFKGLNNDEKQKILEDYKNYRKCKFIKNEEAIDYFESLK